MSKKQWWFLYFLFQCYLFLGAYMFFSIERPLEEERRTLENQERQEIQILLDQHYENGIPLAQVEILEKLESYCGKPFYVNTFNLSRSEEPIDPVKEKPFLWSFYNSFLFCLVTLSTIGYGNLAPTSRHGRMLDVLYGMIGIPFHGIVVVRMSEYFGSVFMRVHHRYKEDEYESRWSLFVDILYYLVPGIIVFILFPAAMFVYFENWYFDTGIYYAYVTLCTIGYGDLVAGQNGSQELSYQIFKIGVLIWIMFGLGYMVMLVNFIARAMRSKKVRKIEHKLAYTIKQTQSRIWNEFTEDVTIIRRMLNEMYLLKFKPVYKDEKEVPILGRKTRSQSAPNLTEWPVLHKKHKKESSSEDEEEVANAFKKQRLHRRRAYSENLMTPVISRVMSEGDLSRIDRNATFGTSVVIEPGLLLARVVDALGTPIGSKFELSDDEDDIKNAKMNGIHGFSDSQILASERESRWSIGGTRLRATSAATPPFKRQSMPVFNEQRTWSGVDPQEILRIAKMRSNGAVVNQIDSKSTRSSKSSLTEQNLQPPPSRMRRMSMAAVNFFSPHKNKSHEQKEKEKEKEKEKDNEKKRRTGNTKSLFPAMPSGKRLSLPGDEQPETMYDQINYLSHTSGRRPSLITALTQELGAKQATGAIPISPMLEQTSIADFLRLISSLHARLDPTKSLTAEDLNLFPKKKSTRTTSMKESPFAALFSPLNDNIATRKDENRSPRNSPGPIPMAPHDRRRVSIVSPPQVVSQPRRPILQPGRRFSLIPPMDVDNPSGARSYSRSSLLDRQRRITSISPLAAGSNPNIAVPPVSKRLRRLSLSSYSRNGSSRSSLHREPTRPKIVPPALVVTNPQGYKKFSIRPVDPAVLLSLPSDSSEPSVKWQSPPSSPPQTSSTTTTKTTDSVETSIKQDNSKSEDEDRRDSLEDVIVVRL